jgi:hypothetical protein
VPLVTKISSNNKNVNKLSTGNQDSISMEYNIVEDLKNIKENISILHVCKIGQQRKLLLNAWKQNNESQSSTIVKNVTKITTNNLHNEIVNVFSQVQSPSLKFLWEKNISWEDTM